MRYLQRPEDLEYLIKILQFDKQNNQTYNKFNKFQFLVFIDLFFVHDLYT